MKTIGLLGGLSWESSREYYRIINEAVAQRLGGVHSAACMLYSVDFAEIERLQHQDRWEECNLTRFVAERGVYASEVKTGKFMRQFLDQGLALYLKVRLN